MGSKRVVPIFHAYQLKVIFSHFIHMLFISKEWEWHYSLFPLCPLGNRYFIKVEEILKGSLDSIPSPSRSREHLKFLLWFFGGQTLLGVVNKIFVQQSLLTTPSKVLPLHLKPTFPPIIWIFTEGAGDGIESKLSS